MVKLVKEKIVGSLMKLNKDNLLKLYPTYNSVLGPYTRPDGRMHVVLNDSSAPKGQKGKTRTISYPKAVVESNIGRTLLPNETIDHNDRDKTNHQENNLVIRGRSIHAALDAVRVTVDLVNCVECGKSFEPSKGQRNSQASKNGTEPAGPFCSRQCSGQYGARVQNGGTKLERQEVTKTYYRKDKK